LNKKKEILLYLVFGGLTTLVNIVTYWFFTDVFDFDYKFSTTIAWLISVIFAYVTNKLYVFQSRQTNNKGLLKEFLSFILFRVFSYILDIVSMIILIEFLLLNDLIAKIIANIIVVAFNFIASKWFIFRKK
jgi:putative flippase GtrA